MRSLQVVALITYGMIIGGAIIGSYSYAKVREARDISSKIVTTLTEKELAISGQAVKNHIGYWDKAGIFQWGDESNYGRVVIWKDGAIDIYNWDTKQDCPGEYSTRSQCNAAVMDWARNQLSFQLKAHDANASCIGYKL